MNTLADRLTLLCAGLRCIIDDLKKVVEGVKELVGELDFSYHIVSTNAPSTTQSQVTLTLSKTNEAQDPARQKTD